MKTKKILMWMVLLMLVSMPLVTALPRRVAAKSEVVAEESDDGDLNDEVKAAVWLRKLAIKKRLVAVDEMNISDEQKADLAARLRTRLEELDGVKSLREVFSDYGVFGAVDGIG